MTKKENEDAVSAESVTVDSKVIEAQGHPSRVLNLRRSGYGIGGGYERPYKQKEKIKTDNSEGLYGPIPLSGYYGGGSSEIRFKMGQAGFRNELPWYGAQFGEETSGYEKKK
jgi:hypothetical protein